MKSFYLILVSTFLLLAGCGGGSGTSSSTDDQQPVAMTSPDAIVGVLLTDAPSDDVEQLIARIESIDLVGSSQTVNVFTGSESVDLLKLPDAYELFSISQVPADTYEIVRIRISEVKIVTEDAAGQLVETPATLTSNEIDIMLVPPVTVAEGAVLFLEIDFDVDKTLEGMVEENGTVTIEPVFFVKLDDEPPRAKIVRIHGNFTPTDTGYQICDTQLVSNTEDKRRSLAACADLVVDDETGYFGEDGLPVDDGIMGFIEGDPVTVVGYIHAMMDSIPAIEYGHLPPPGECRLWYLDREPGQQPPPKKCEEFEGMDVPDNALVINDQGLPVSDIYGIDALVLEKGPLDTFGQYRGKATTTVVEDLFNFLVEGHYDMAGDQPITTRLFEKTRIFSTDGVEQDASIIRPELKATIDGVIAMPDMAPHELRAAFIMVKLDDDMEMRLSGTFVRLDGNNELTMTTETGDRCVDAGGADVYLVWYEDGRLVSMKIELDDLVADQALDVYGYEDGDGCFKAKTILADGAT